MTIASLKIMKKKDHESFERGEYYFVIKSRIKFNKQDHSFMFYNSRILITENDIQKWWLSQFRDYNTKTKIIHDLYDYLPPPPYLPPKNLK